MKFYLATFLFFFFLSTHASADPFTLVKLYLNEVKKNSTEFQISNLREESSLLSSKSDLASFDLTGSLSADLTDSESPQTSPFSPSSTKQYNYSAGVSKKWISGFDTSVDYKLTDNLTTFPSRSNSDYLSPDLSLTLKTSVFRELIDGKNRSIEKRIEKEQKSISIKSKIQKKTILVTSVLSLAEVLETSYELQLQESLCKSISSQTRSLRQKRARRSISEREFLLSRKDLNSCLATKKALKKALSERKENLIVKYGVPASFYHDYKIVDFFEAITQLYGSNSQEIESVNISKFDELVSLKLDMDSLKLKEREIDADLKPDVSLQLTTGLQGLRSTFDSAHEDLTNSEYPYIYAAISVGFPFANRTAKINSSVNSIQKEILKRQIAQKEKESHSRLKLLHEGIKNDLSIYKSIEENVSLSERALNEARRDFNNGRINFFTYSEFQKGLIQSRQQLASLRSNIIIQTVEYIDYFQFFDRHF